MKRLKKFIKKLKGKIWLLICIRKTGTGLK